MHLKILFSVYVTGKESFFVRNTWPTLVLKGFAILWLKTFQEKRINPKNQLIFQDENIKLVNASFDKLIINIIQDGGRVERHPLQFSSVTSPVT